MVFIFSPSHSLSPHLCHCFPFLSVSPSMPCFSAALSFDCWGKKNNNNKKGDTALLFFVLFLFCFLLCLFVFTTHLIYHEAIHTCSLCSAPSLPPHPCNIYITLVLQWLLIIFQCEGLTTGSSSDV